MGVRGGMGDLHSLVVKDVVIVTDTESDSEYMEIDSDDNAYPKRHGTPLTLAIQTAASHEEDLCSYLRHVNIVCHNSSFILAIRILFIIIALFIFVVGAFRFHECPYEEELPLFLVFEGLTILAKNGIVFINMCTRRTKDENERHCLDTCNDILTLFFVLWTLTGSIWTVAVFVHAETTYHDGPKYCDKFVVFSSLGFIIFLYSCVILFISVLIVLSSYFYTKSRSNSNDLPYNVQVDKL